MTSDHDVVYREHVQSVIPFDATRFGSALVIEVTRTHLDVRLDDLVTGMLPPQMLPEHLARIHEPLDDIKSAETRRMSALRWLWELWRGEYRGAGLRGTRWNVRGVRTGVEVESRRGLIAWIATRNPDALAAAVLRQDSTGTTSSS